MPINTNQETRLARRTDNLSMMILLLRCLVVMGSLPASNAKTLLVDTPLWRDRCKNLLSMIPANLWLNALESLGKEQIQGGGKTSDTRNLIFLRIHQETLNVYLKDITHCLQNSASLLFSEEPASEYFEPYLYTVILLYHYSQHSASHLTDHLTDFLLDQLIQLISVSSDIDLSPSWIERLQDWLLTCFSKLRLWFSSPRDLEKLEKNTTPPLFLKLIPRLKKQVSQLTHDHQREDRLRHQLWFYFSFAELIARYANPNPLPESLLMELLTLFLNTFHTFHLKYRHSKYHIPTQFPFNNIPLPNPLLTLCESGVSDIDTLINTALSTLAEWFWHDKLLSIKMNSIYFYQEVKKRTRYSVYRWIFSRYESEAFEILKTHAAAYGDHELELPFSQQKALYRLTDPIHQLATEDLSKITRVILSHWLQEVGIQLPYMKIQDCLLAPQRWLSFPAGTLYRGVSLDSVYIWQYRLAHEVIKSVESLAGGIAIYFFPGLRKKWELLEAKFLAYHGPAMPFLSQNRELIKAVIWQLLRIYSPSIIQHHLHNDRQKDQIFRAYKSITHYRNSLRTEWRNYDQPSYLKPTLTQKIHDDYYSEEKMKQGSAEQLLEKVMMTELMITPLSAVTEKVRYSLVLEPFFKETRNKIKTERAEKEAALAATETERTEKEAALAEKEAALAEVKRLKALLTATNPSTPEPGPSQPVGGAPIPLAMPSTATLFKPYAQTAVIEEQDKPIPAEVNHAYQH